MGKTLCEVYHCNYNSQRGMHQIKKWGAKPHCTRGNLHIDQNGLCLNKTPIPRKVNITFALPEASDYRDGQE